jgi:hypothetical protein
MFYIHNAVTATNSLHFFGGVGSVRNKKRNKLKGCAHNSNLGCIFLQNHLREID